jgi:hypothetical protein
VRRIYNHCPIAAGQEPLLKKRKGAAKPIMSGNFRERFQCDLIDFREKCVKDKHGNVMRWLMVLKDHFTRFVYMRPLPTKEAKGVCYELNIFLSLIGFPEFCHSDNSGEVCAAEIIDMLTEENPTIDAVRGRPRKPSTQGSVERANRSMKTMIASLEEEQKQKGEAKIGLNALAVQ